MIGVFDFIPTFCPHCGSRTHTEEPANRHDYLAQASHSCSCGFKFQHAATEHILEASDKSGGDMRQYAVR